MKKNIAILIPQLTGGGAERVASNLSLYLPENKYNKYIIVYNSENIDYPYKGTLIDLNIKAGSNPLTKLTNTIKRIYSLKKVKKNYNIDITISFLSSPNIVNILSRGRGKTIVSVRNFISKSSKGFYGTLFKLSIKALYNKADAIVVVSKAINKDLVENYSLDENKVKVIYNPYDIDKISKLAKEKIDEKYQEIFKKPTIITTGRLTKQKGQWHLLRAFKKVKSEIPDAKLVILGKGPLEYYLKELAADLGIDNDVHFLGFKRNPFKYIARSKIYVFPSLYEGFPNALCEAMACGIPVISTDCKSGPREILAPSITYEMAAELETDAQYGILIPVCDGKYHPSSEGLTSEERILAKSIIELYSNDILYNSYSKLSRERIKSFASDKIVEEYNILFSNLLK